MYRFSRLLTGFTVRGGKSCTGLGEILNHLVLCCCRLEGEGDLTAVVCWKKGRYPQHSPAFSSSNPSVYPSVCPFFNTAFIWRDLVCFCRVKMASSFARVLTSKRKVGILSLVGAGSLTVGFFLNREQHVNAGANVRRIYPAR